MATFVKNTYTLLDAATIPVNAAKSCSAISRSGSTATATITAHGYLVGDWFILQGATHPYYNGVFQVATVVDANNITYTMQGDPGGAASLSSATAQKGVITKPWGDGSTAVGGVTSLGHLTTALDGEWDIRVTTGAAAPGAGPNFLPCYSPTGALGTLFYGETYPLYSSSAVTTVPLRVPVEYRNMFGIGFIYGNTSNTVIADVYAREVTSIG